MADEDFTSETEASTSCAACRRVKVRCSRDQPSCRRCITHELDCEYFGVTSRSGRHKSAKRQNPVTAVDEAAPAPCEAPPSYITSPSEDNITNEEPSEENGPLKKATEAKQTTEDYKRKYFSLGAMYKELLAEHAQLLAEHEEVRRRLRQESEKRQELSNRELAAQWRRWQGR